MSDDEAIQRLVGYLRQNAQAYNLNALRRQLITQGERPELVDAALARVQAELPQPVGRLRPALPWAGGALVVALALAGLLISQQTGLDNLGWLLWLLLATAIYAGLGLALLLGGAVVLLFKQRRVGMPIIFGGLLALALSAIVVALFFGVCLVLYSTSTF